MLISAREAARRLGVKPATLYSYVSRGLLRSAPVADSRQRGYDAEDIARLKRLRYAGPRIGVPPKAFDTSIPLLDTALCHVENGRLYYRGSDATELAESADLEGVARLLWGQVSSDQFDVSSLQPELRRLLRGPSIPVAPIDRSRMVMAGLAMHDISGLDVSALAVARTGARLVPALAAAVTGKMLTKGPVHGELARAWSLDDDASDLLRRTLVLSADHELNASTYVGRCIASTGASPYTVILGALCALSGPKNGGQANEVETLLREALRTRDIRSVIAERLQRGEQIPGFGHAIYPEGDPRAAHIINAVRASRYGRQGKDALQVGHEISELIGRPPNFDFALALVPVVLKLPPGSGLGIFLVGRSVGWIAHAIEQYVSGALIRPRARYVGVLPEAALEQN